MAIRSFLLCASILAAAGPAAAQTPPAAPPPAEFPQPTVTPPTTAAPAPPALPRKLEVGPHGFFQPGLLLQGWFLADRAGDATTSTFRARRTEISAKGEIIPGRFAYAVMFDPSKVLEPLPETFTDSAGDTVDVPQPPKAISVLQDLYLTFLSRFADVSLGQFKIPVSWEGYNSSAKLLFPERALVSTKFGDKRDLGLRVAKTFKHFGYFAGIYNGAGANNFDNNNAKDLTLRLEGYPIPGLVVAGVVYGSVREDDTPDTKVRYEGDLRFTRGPFLFQNEFIWGRDYGRDSTGLPTHVDSQGFYSALAYTFLERLQAAVRVGYLDNDLDVPDDQEWEFDAGLNYYFAGDDMKLQASYSRFQFDDHNPAGKQSANEVIVAAQIHF